MALYAGEAVRVRAEIIDPDTDQTFVVAEGESNPSATIKLWAPGKNPVKDPGIRDSPDHGPDNMDYRESVGDFIVFVHTRGSGISPDPTGEKWEPGKWSFRVEVTGNVFTNWEYGTFTLRP